MSEHAHALARLYLHAELIHHVVSDHHSHAHVKEAESRLVEHLKKCPGGHAEHLGLSMQLHSVSIEGKTSHYVKFAGELPIHDHGSVSIRAGMQWKRGRDLVKVGIEATAARERVRIRKQRTT